MNKLTFTTEIKESKYLHVYENENIYALYHAYYMNVVYLNKSSFATFNNLKKHKTLEDFCHVNPDLNKNKILSLFESLFQNGIITTYNNRERIDSAYIKNHSNIDIQIMYLIVTDSCNLKCKYCYIENSIPEDAKKVFMTEDLVSKSIDLFSKISKKNRRIIFYGGEPFLNKKTLKKGISYAREILKNDVELSIITNASDITKEDASFLEKHNVQISISIDGNKDITDSVRPFISGKGTYSSIQKSVKNLRDAGISNISASVTIGKHNYRTLKDQTKHLMTEFNFNSFGFNFLIDFPKTVNPQSVDIAIATKSLLETFEFLRKNGLYEDRIMRKLKPFVEKKLYQKDCGAIGNQIVITPDGLIGPCQGFLYNKEYYSSELWDAEKISIDSSFKEWSKRYPLNMPECTNCEAIAICGGGCAYQAKISSDSLWSLDKRMCTHNKILLEWIIWDMYKNIKKNWL